jgi:hypothetical protein
MLRGYVLFDVLFVAWTPEAIFSNLDILKEKPPLDSSDQISVMELVTLLL